MTKARRVIALLLLAAMLLSLAGCSIGKIGKEEKELRGILDDIAASFRSGGDTLTAVRLAAELADWTKNTTMSKQEIGKVIAAWLKEQAPEIRENFGQKLSSLAESSSAFAKESINTLLEAAGVEKDLSNLGTRVLDLIKTVFDSGGIK